ncbi:MAG: hypothetical protein DVB29_05775 [Verrucomicrobia bacterium]|nr:MAG: hypothetical protein DVB29_05775 [Verrucomicrobiota bacterium]
MRIIESFSGWNREILSESTKAAKEYMFQLAAKKNGQSTADLSPEDREKILADPKYAEIVSIGSTYPNYLPALLKFGFEHKASAEDLKGLLQTMQDKKQLLTQLGRSPQEVLDDYSNREPKDGIAGFEQLTDAIRTIERAREAKWFIDAMPQRLRDQYRSLSPEEKQPFITAAFKMQELGEDATKRFFKKIMAFANSPISEVGDYISRYLKGFANLDLQKKIDNIEKLEPEAGIIYSDDQYLVMSVRTEQAQKDLCSVANWCINRGSFATYANDAVQINIFNFGIPSNDPMFLTGTTVYYTGKVRTSHDIDDAMIKKSDDPAKHLSELGYPADVVNTIIRELPREMMVKKVIYELNLDKKKPIEVLFNIVKQSYAVDPETNPESLAIVLDIVQNRIKDNLSKGEVVDLYTKAGVLSKFSAMLVKMLIDQNDQESMRKIVDATLKIFATVNQIAKDDPSLVFPQVKNVLAQEKDVLKELGLSSGDIESVMEYIDQEMIDEFLMAEPAVKPRTAPTIAPTRPMPKRPGPVPTKQPFKAPEPAKAEAEDVIARYEELIKKEKSTK